MLSGIGFAASAIGAAVRKPDPVLIALYWAIGAGSVLAPLYIAEIAPARDRGRLVSLNQMAIVIGILLAYLVNWGLSSLGSSSWRWMFAAAAVPLVFVPILCPESPRWLVEVGRSGEALAVLIKLNGSSVATGELRNIEETVAQETGTLAELFRPPFRKPLFIAISLAILQQITGINTVLFYGALIFKQQVGQQMRAQRSSQT